MTKHRTMQPLAALTRLWPRRKDAVLLALVAGAGAALGAAQLRSLEISDWAGLLLLTAFAAVLERFGTRLFARTRASVSAVPLLAAGMLLGASAVVPLAVAISASAWVFRSRPASRLVFNAGQLVLSASAAVVTYEWVSGVLPHGDASAAAAAVSAGVAMWAISSLLVGSMLAATSDQSLGRILRENYAWLVVHFAAMGVVGLGLARAWDEVGMLALVAFVAPLGAFALALRQGAAMAQRAIREAQHARRLLSQLSEPSEEVRDLIAARSTGTDG